jgi:hypothetical protein
MNDRTLLREIEMRPEDGQAYIDNVKRSKRKRDEKAIVTHRSKFHSVICEADGIKFRSKRERKRYLELSALKNDGFCWFLRQIPFYLPGNTKYVLDFMVFWKSGGITFEDTKGHRTPMYIMKKKQVEALYPIRITEI